MLYAKCPVCGGKVESAESDVVSKVTRGTSRWLRSEAIAKHPHPLVKLAVVGVVAGNAIYRRVPGGGRKQCTACGHQFR